MSLPDEEFIKTLLYFRDFEPENVKMPSEKKNTK